MIYLLILGCFLVGFLIGFVSKSWGGPPHQHKWVWVPEHVKRGYSHSEPDICYTVKEDGTLTYLGVAVVKAREGWYVFRKICASCGAVAPTSIEELTVAQAQDEGAVEMGLSRSVLGLFEASNLEDFGQDPKEESIDS